MAHKVYELATGPLIGHTTSGGFRLWGRPRSDSPAMGAARIRKQGATEFDAPILFPFAERYDRIGIVDIGRLFEDSAGSPLEAGAVYEYQVGWISTAGLRDEPSAADEFDWRVQGENQYRLSGTVRTAPSPGDDAAGTVFLLGSCRDPMPPGDKGEGTFQTIAEDFVHDSAGNTPDFIIMTGDQIYVDHIRSPADEHDGASFGKFAETYRDAFGLPHFSNAMRHLPAYVAMDDHEVQNNWTRGKFEYDQQKPEAKRRFLIKTMENGLRAYEAYQGSLTPVIMASEFGIQPFPEVAGRTKYSYTFSHGSCDFFVLDARSDSDVRRKLDEKNRLDEPTILRPEHQLAEFKQWLVDDSSKVKFVVSSVPVFPDTRSIGGSPEDKWGGAVRQRAELLDYIWDHREAIPRLVFLSGDVHVSYIAKLIKHGVDDYRIYNVVSSAFNWVAPGLQSFNFDWGRLDRKAKDGTRPGERYVSERFSEHGIKGVHKRNNFARISADKDRVQVEFIRGRDGNVLEDTTLVFSL